MRARTLCLTAAVAILGSLSIARAEAPCAADIKALCGDVPAGGGRIQACLEENEAKVSPDCKARIDDLAKEAKLTAVVCRWDLGRFCSDVAPGQGKVLACLNSHESQLSAECKTQLASLKK